jgi:hypothetical protein
MKAPSWFLPSLDAKDRKLLLWSLGTAAVLAVAIGILSSGNGNDDDRVPSTYLNGKHGALAAYELLERAGYRVERWERPLNELAAEAGPQTVVILADPFTPGTHDMKAVRQILEKGGRVVSTGLLGGFVLPGQNVAPANAFGIAACKLTPQGLDPLASSGEVWMLPQASWKLGNPAARVQYTCAGDPAVVEYDWGKGHAVWWSSSTPLENGSLGRAQDLDFFLNSLGPREGKQFYWDESLHGDIRTVWSYAGGPALTLLEIGLAVLALLILFSFSRRSGPVRELPGPVRATPMEFLEALGSLYRSAGASSTAVAIAWERFRRDALQLCGMRMQKIGAGEMAAIVRARFSGADASLETDLAEAEAAAGDEGLAPREGLRIVQALAAQSARLHELARSGRSPANQALSQSVGARW